MVFQIGKNDDWEGNLFTVEQELLGDRYGQQIFAYE